MSARDELLRDGRLGEAGAELLYETVYSVAVANNIPAPPNSYWSEQRTVEEAAHEFLRHRQTPRRLTDITIRSTDDPSFARLLAAAVLNYFRDEARQTDLGSLIVRVKEILADNRRYERVEGRSDLWGMKGRGRQLNTVAERDLAKTIAHTEITVPRWTSERRHAPLADRESFERLIDAVLTAANGVLSAADIARVLTTRLDHRRVPTVVELDVQEHFAEPRATDPASHTVNELHAMDIFNRLSDRERIVVTTLDEGVRDLSVLINTGKTQAATIRSRVLSILRTEFVDDREADETASILIQLCDEWVRERTIQDGGTFDS